MNILVTGGCGYIGSHTLVELIEAGHQVYCIDNLSNSTEDSLIGVARITNQHIPNYCIDLCDKPTVIGFFEHHKIDAIIHFAAHKSVPESIEKPGQYYTNNVNSLTILLECCAQFEIKQFIFSSSCSVYGNIQSSPVNENTPLGTPLCPYAATKQIGEQLIKDASKYLSTQFSILRYFNPAGAHKSALLGEYPNRTPANIIPAINSATAGKSGQLLVYGNTYPTPDGTCIRDYLHVCDVASAHLAALNYHINQPLEKLSLFNLGMGKGISVLQAITTFEAVNGVKVPYKIVDPRPGDVAEIYADCSKAHQNLGWKWVFTLEDIVESAWKWQVQSGV